MDLFNSPIKEVSFNIDSNENLDTISKSLVEDGKTLKFKLKNMRNLDRKSLNLLRKREISSVIN